MMLVCPFVAVYVLMCAPMCECEYECKSICMEGRECAYLCMHIYAGVCVMYVEEEGKGEGSRVDFVLLLCVLV